MGGALTPACCAMIGITWSVVAAATTARVVLVPVRDEVLVSVAVSV